MSERILVTGRTGFIGRHLCRELLERGNNVRVLDALIDQVHPGEERPADLSADVKLIIDEVRHGDAVSRALQGVDRVVHLVAEVGVGQSMYEVERCTATNDLGTAVLMERLIDNSVQRIVTASSMSIYGEGLYRDPDGDLIEDAARGVPRDGQAAWDPVDAAGRPLTPVALPNGSAPTRHRSTPSTNMCRSV